MAKIQSKIISTPLILQLPDPLEQGDGMLWAPSPREVHLAQARRRAFSVVTLSLWNIIPIELRLAPTLILFHKALNTWVFLGLPMDLIIPERINDLNDWGIITF